MKKFIALFCAAAVLAFAGMAFAADGGHGGHVTPVTPDTNSFKTVTVSSGDVQIPGATVNEAKGTTKAELTALLSGTPKFATGGKIPVIQTAVTLDVDFGGTYPASVDLGIKVGGYEGTTTGLKVFVKNKSTDVFDSFAITSFVSGDLKFNMTSPDQYFTANTILLGTVKDAPSSGGSSSGCNAGFAGLLLLAAAPLLYFRKK